ncbi:hypothetical protein ACFYXM_35580 [Streptomyces sp. NPDC002476]|uniref:hypothetical protein n=1 Tax=Streptomyces sp. NPDC002476 TaxID=3364648 RepID=UPI0036C578B7
MKDEVAGAHRPEADEGGRHDGSHGGFARAIVTVMRRNWRVLLGRTVCVTGLAALGGLAVTAAAFALARPAFAEMWNGALAAREDEDSYAPDVSPLLVILLGGLPALLLILCLGCAALQTVHSREVAAAVAGRSRAKEKERPPNGTCSRLGRVTTVYVLRSVAVWTIPMCAMLVTEYLTSTTFTAPAPLRPESVRSDLVRVVVPGLAVVVALLLRLGLALAPAAAAGDGLTPMAALRRSWSLVWGWTPSLRTVAVVLPTGVITVGTYWVLHRAGGPLRDGVRSAVLTYGTDNPYVAYAAGVLAPIAAAMLLTAALVLPAAHTAHAVLHERLSSPGGLAAGTGGRAVVTE